MPILYVLILSILLSACATTTPIDGQQTLPTNTLSESGLPANNIKKGDSYCRYVLRNLSIPWSHRDYWCGSSISDGESAVDGGGSSRSLNEARQRESLLQAAAIKATQQPGVVSAIPVNQDPQVLPRLFQEEVSEVSLISEKNKVRKIWFATGREALGPQGRKQALDLIEQVHDARYVTVRGLLVDGEFGGSVDVDAIERRSVGRALSVRELWRQAGVDTRITILHHTSLRKGRYVEVNIHD